MPHQTIKPVTSMAFLSIIFLIFLLSSTTPSASGAGTNNSKTAYEVLQEYDFPIGILPNGVIGYTLDRSTGKFAAFLEDTCTFTIASYELKYRSKITGVITKDKVSNLSGISVKVLILWLNIVEVIRDGDELQFSVGIASADFPVSNFTECATCGCGFDCVSGTGHGKKVKFNPLMSSY